MKDIYLWFYCMPISEAAVLILCGVAGFLYLRERFSGRGWWKAGVGGVLAVWLVVVLWATLADRGEDPSGKLASLVPLASYWRVLRGGNIELLRVNFMNTVLFFPGGLLVSVFMPERWSLGRRFAAVAAGCCIVSVGIEIVQYLLGVGLAETDDVIHNTLGGILGFWASRMPVRVGPMTHSGTGRGS